MCNIRYCTLAGLTKAPKIGYTLYYNQPMTLLVHAAAGALIGQYANNPAIAFFYGILSHIILDAVPHGDSGLYKKYKNKEVSARKAMAGSIIDSICAIIFVLIFFNLDIAPSRLITSLAIVGSIIPDILIGFYELLEPKAPKVLRIIHRWHFKNHDFIAKKYDLSLKRGRMLQVIIFFILMRML